MGSGVLKTLSPYKVSHHQFLYVFSCCCYPSKPRISLLLWGLSICSCDRRLFFLAYTSVVYYCFAPLAGAWGPASGLVWFVPCMLRAIATQMSLLVTCVALNFAEVSRPPSTPSSLHVSSPWNVSSSRHGCRVHFFAPCNASPRSSCRCVHGVWVG